MAGEVTDQTIESLKWAHEIGRIEYKPDSIGGKPVYVGPKELIVTGLEKFASEPYRVRVHEKFATIDSFVEYVARFGTSDTILKASIADANITAFIDYHGVGEPSWVTHKAELVSARTPEWLAVTGANKVEMSQQKLAEFLEMWSPIIIQPTSAEILEVAMNLTGSLNSAFSAKYNRANGSYTMSYQEDLDTGQVRVPTGFKVSVSPFHYCGAVDLDVFLRVRIEDKRPKFFIEIPNIPREEYKALAEMFEKVQTLADRSVLVGP